MQAEQRCFQCERRAPLILQDVQTDCPVGAAHIGVPHLTAEAHLGRHKRVLVLCMVDCIARQWVRQGDYV